MNQRTLLFGMAAMALMTVVMVEPALAQTASSAGATAKSTLENAVTGNLGLILGLGITIAGLWTWIIGQKTAAGLTMVLGGVLLTLAPGLFNGARKMVGGVVDQFSGSNTETVDADYND
jgi:hypothetical protein